MPKRSLLALATAFALTLTGTALLADPPVVNTVKAVRYGDTWRFDVTLSHGDTGWDHYADGWRVLDAEGNQLGIRNLAHPHVNEQPFTRSLSGVRVPEGVTEVTIQARDNITGWGPVLTRVRLN